MENGKTVEPHTTQTDQTTESEHERKVRLVNEITELQINFARKFDANKIASAYQLDSLEFLYHFLSKNASNMMNDENVQTIKQKLAASIGIIPFMCMAAGDTCARKQLISQQELVDYEKIIQSAITNFKLAYNNASAVNVLNELLSTTSAPTNTSTNTPASTLAKKY